MGIPGLLNALRDITRPVHIRDFHGLKAGVDASCWLHKGVYCCSNELMEGKDTDKYVEYCMERLRLLQRHGVEVVVVFDGRPLPAKAHTHQLRRSAREENRERAEKALQDGSKVLAQQFFQKSLEITHEMSHKLVLELQSQDINVIVAPYEADAQLAFLSKNGLIDFVITEDSDTIPFGCKRCLFKMDKEGYGQEIQRKHLGANGEPSFLNWSDDMFLLMCVLAGCDYLPKIPQLGLKTAHRLVKKHRTQQKLLAALRSSKFELPEEYETMFEEARLTFRHQTVFDPAAQQLIPMTPLPYHLDGQELPFLGALLPAGIAVGIAAGELHPFTLQEFPQPTAATETTEQNPTPASLQPRMRDAEQLDPIGEPLPPPVLLLREHVSTSVEHTTFKPKWRDESTPDNDANELYDWNIPDAINTTSELSLSHPTAIQRSSLQQLPPSFPLNMLHFSSPIVNSNMETLHRRKRRLGSNPSSDAGASESSRQPATTSPPAGRFFDRRNSASPSIKGVTSFQQMSPRSYHETPPHSPQLLPESSGEQFRESRKRRNGSGMENLEYVNTVADESSRWYGHFGQAKSGHDSTLEGLPQFQPQNLTSFDYDAAQYSTTSHSTRQESRESYWDRVLGRDL